MRKRLTEVGNRKVTALITAAALTVLGLTACQGAAAQPSTEAKPAAEAAAQGSAGASAATATEPTTLDTIKANGYITFATEGTYAPYSFHDDANNLVGFDVEIARAIAEKLGVEARFTETQWDGIIAGLDANKYDAISNQVSITEERLQKYLFSDPYTYVYGVVIVNEDNDAIKSFEDLDGKDVSLTVTSNWAQVAESYGGKIVSTSGFNESIQLVLQNRVDATVNDNVTFYDFIANQPDAKAKIVATSDDATESAILIRKGDDDLQAAINDALSQLKSEGKLKEISEKYFGTDITVPN